jgi:chromosome transmission fidelity protein 8
LGDAGPELGDDAMVLDSLTADSGGHPTDNASSWSVVGIVKKKIVFSKRPMPVMGKQSLVT